MENNNLKNRITLIGSVLVIIFLIGLFIYAIVHNYKKNKALESDPMYTVGIVTDVGSALGQKLVAFDYVINGLHYFDEFHPGIHKYILNGRYVVKFSRENPKYNNLLSIVIPDSIKNVPPQGWTEPPGKIYSIGKVNYVVNNAEAQIRIRYNSKEYYLKVKENFIKEVDKGKNYYISFYPSDLDYNTKLYNESVPDSLFWNMPKEGWAEKPKGLNK